MEAKEKNGRFVLKEHGISEGGMQYQVLVDTATGVNYLRTLGHGVPQILPLLGRDGKPIIG